MFVLGGIEHLAHDAIMQVDNLINNRGCCLDHHGHQGRIAALRLEPRNDSSFPEVGPPPALTPAGIVVLYNGKNSATSGDPALGPNAYAAGEALFAADDPTRLLARDDSPTLQPTMPYEKTGQYAAGTTFAEGLVFFRDRWFLYYGCADSFVAAATAPAAPRLR